VVDIKLQDIFIDAMQIYIDYINRQLKKNSNYMPHPLIRAFECALQNFENIKEGECTMGVSQDGTTNDICNPYIVVLQKQQNRASVKEIKNIKLNKTLPLDIMIIIFRLQTKIDKIEGDAVTPEQMVNILNDVIPGNKFFALGDRWKEARDHFKKLLEEGKINVPDDPEIIQNLKKVTYNTPWEEYGNKLRALIGITIVDLLDSKYEVVITSPKDFKIPKYEVFDKATEFLLVKPAEYFQSNKNGE